MLPCTMPCHRSRLCPAAPQALSSSSSRSSNALPGGQQQLWLPDRSALKQAGVGSWGFVPEGVQSALLQAVPGGKQLLLVLAEKPRALSHKDRKWVAAVANKLGGVL
eukprot:GHRQ01031694.1.p1 GENE.GHRQ01031694.1~~GHRQ01031694.1.p1  ORF type:complete len:107 (+),score=63.30 GHRQ01031694.1:3-323(+)